MDTDNGEMRTWDGPQGQAGRGQWGEIGTYVVLLTMKIKKYNNIINKERKK